MSWSALKLAMARSMRRHRIIVSATQTRENSRPTEKVSETVKKYLGRVAAFAELSREGSGEGGDGQETVDWQVQGQQWLVTMSSLAGNRESEEEEGRRKEKGAGWAEW
jgi:hypothetical protein